MWSLWLYELEIKHDREDWNNNVIFFFHSFFFYFEVQDWEESFNRRVWLFHIPVFIFFFLFYMGSTVSPELRGHYNNYHISVCVKIQQSLS